MKPLFLESREVLKEHDKHRQHTRRHKYLLKGLVHSLDADSSCWAETNPKKNISYYRSRAKVNGSQVYYNASNIDSQLLDIVRDITISDGLKQELRNDLQNWFNDEGKSNDELKQAEARLAKLRRMEKNLQQLMLEEEITLADFKEHRIKIEAERARLQNIVDAIKQRQHLIKADFEVALQLATELDFLFEKGNFDEKRLLCETVFKRIYLKEGKVSEVELNAPLA